MERRGVALAFTDQRDVNAHKIRLAKGVFKRDILDPGLFLLDAAGVAEIHLLLNRLYVFVILIRRVVAKNVHVEAGALLNHRESYAAGANNRDGLPGNFVPEERQKRVPESPLLIA